MKFLLQFLLLITVVHFSAPLLAQKEGKKKRVAVFIFDDKTDNGRSWWGQRTVGEGMSDMVITELVKTGQYTVLERQELDELLREQDLGASGIVTPESAAEIGKVLGVELAVMGAVTEFGYNKSDTDVRVDRTRVGLGMQSAAVGMDVKGNQRPGAGVPAHDDRRLTRRRRASSVAAAVSGAAHILELGHQLAVGFFVALADLVEQGAGAAFLGQPALGDHAVEQRHEEHRQEGRGEHAAHHSGADRMAGTGAGAS